MPYRQPVGRAEVRIERPYARSTVISRLDSGYDYFVVIQGAEGFSAVFDGRGEPKAAVVAAVFSTEFENRLTQTALNLGETLYVEILGYSNPGSLAEMKDFRLRHEAPALLVMEATYDEGAAVRALRAITA